MRYRSDREFPPYAFLPGRDPHPTREPEGHSFDAEHDAQKYVEPSRWRENGEFVWGVDLYNHGYLWEAHEAWEAVWHASKADVSQALFVQGLIQCTAACLKIRMEQPRGLQRLSELGIEKLTRVARSEGDEYMGIRVRDFAEEMSAFADSSPTSIDARPRLVLEGLNARD